MPEVYRSLPLQETKFQQEQQLTQQTRRFCTLSRKRIRYTISVNVLIELQGHKEANYNANDIVNGSYRLLRKLEHPSDSDKRLGNKH